MAETAGIIGDPVSHSLSPAIHNAAYKALGLDWHYCAYRVEKSDVKAAVRGAMALSLRGLSVTMPHKHAVSLLADKKSDVVKRLGSANTITFSDGEIIAESTDGQGLLDDILDWGLIPVGKKIVIIGNGGAAKAALLSLANAGAAEVVVLGRREDAAVDIISMAEENVKYELLSRLGSHRDADLFINATPVGMGGNADLESSELSGLKSIFSEKHWVLDMIYSPLETPIMKTASRCGAKVRNGLGMLIHQAAIQFYIWTGCEPPLQVMWEAVLANLKE
ncbi:MAG: shikimate dehydrogenase [Firmicutes bacterium]|nr:shikimate dehydrogenase [Bacillota bacterium]